MSKRKAIRTFNIRSAGSARLGRSQLNPIMFDPAQRRIVGVIDFSKEQLFARVLFLRRWHVLLRLLWALEHNYEEGIAPRFEHLTRLMALEIT